MTNGIFGNMFDFNHDGELDAMEKGMEFMFLDKMMHDLEDDDTETDINIDGGDGDDYDDD